MAGEVTPAPGTDRTVLRTAAYADATKLNARISIYAYGRPEFDLIASVLDQLPVGANARVLDVGCGPGRYLAALAARDPSVLITGLDLSSGMLATARAAGVTSIAVSDATALPVATASFDGVMANHMLYHVDPIGQAVAELRRVLRPGATLLAVTNAEAHFAEFDTLLAEVSGSDGWWRPSHRFTIDNGRAALEEAFDQVEVVEFKGELHVPDAEPVVRFARSMRDLSGHGYDDADWESLMVAFEARVNEVISAEGEFRATTDTGVFVCR